MKMIYQLLIALCLMLVGCQNSYQNPPEGIVCEVDSNYLQEEELIYTGLVPPCIYLGEWCIGQIEGEAIVVKKDYEWYGQISDLPFPQSPWRVPTKQEAQIIRSLSPPWWEWYEKRYICQDENGKYYSFKFGNEGTISACGSKTKYYVLLIKLI